MLRADVDALPVQETDDNLIPCGRKCKSKVDGLCSGRKMTHRELLESLGRYEEAEEYYD